MREILFKAKRKRDGKWVEGSLIKIHHSDYRIVEDADLDFAYTNEYLYEGGMTMVEPETISQYTGLCDKNGRKIFENDIVRTQEYSDKPYAKNRKTKRHIGVVEYDIGKGSGFYNEETETHDKYREYSAEWSVNVKNYGIYRHGDWGDFFDCEVIGNVFDNPELLEGN